MVLDVQDIINSVSVPALIKDDFIKKGYFLKLKNGDLQAYVGGFSIVFPIEVNGDKWAFRCWHRTLDDALERIKLLSVEIKKVRLPYFLNYDYVDPGITVNGSNYPTTRMRWVDGITIKDYLIANCNSKSKLLKLADNFLKLVKDMHKHSFAHGDLQHGNIIVNERGDLFLVDYDSFYIPRFKGKEDIITGLKDYQHPARKFNKITSEKIDYFSELIIYTSVLGVAYCPSLVNKYQVEDSERMLFESKDFDNIKRTFIYKDLKKLDPIFSVLLSILEQYLTKNTIDDLEPFDILMERMIKAPEIVSFKSSSSVGLYVGDKVRLSWSIDGATNVFIDGKNIKSNSCERTLSVRGINSYTLKAVNEFKETRKSLQITAYAIPEISLTAENTTLHKNSSEETIISWNVNNAYKVLLCYDGVSEEVDTNSRKKFSPKETTKFVLRVIGLDKKRIFSKEIIVGVYEPARVIFASDKSEVLSKDMVLLNWHTENANEVKIVGVGSVAKKGTHCVTPENDTIYKLEVCDHFGTKEYNLPIKVLPLPVVQFRSDKKKLNKDKAENVNITWNVKNASNVLLVYLDSEENVKEKGSKKIRLDESSKIMLKCLALDGKTIFREEIEIKVFKEAKIKFVSNRKYTIPEVPVEISWDVENSKSVELKGYGKVSSQGTREISVKEETTFTLVVTDEFSVQEQSVVVKMLPLPVVKSISVPIPGLNKPLSVIINIPNPEFRIEIPQIKLPNINFKIPDSPNMSNVFESISEKTRSITSEITKFIYSLFKR